MPEELNYEELLASNPGVDKNELQRIRELREELERSGMESAKYRIALPGSRRRVTVRDDPKTDPRTVRLGRRR